MVIDQPGNFKIFAKIVLYIAKQIPLNYWGNLTTLLGEKIYNAGYIGLVV